MVAKVVLWDMFVGAVIWNRERGYATFEYDDEFIQRGLDISPVVMPVKNPDNPKGIYSFSALNKETYKGLPGLLSDSLPDRYGNRIIDRWLAKQGRSQESFNPVERLCYIGRRGMGALEYEPVLSRPDNFSEKIEINELVSLAAEILNERRNLKTNLKSKVDEGLKQIIKVGTSAGGARAKAIIAYNKNTGEVRSGQIDDLPGFEYWLIKFDGVQDNELGNPRGYGRIEYAYNRMAKDCGIETAESALFTENNRAHFMTKRFDRSGSEKLHMQTLCGIAHYDYNDPLAYSYEQAFRVMRVMRLPYTAAEQLFRRMVFNVITLNRDDHTKNISFLMDKNGVWRLAPAYDITFSYNPQSKWISRHQLSVNGKRENITLDDLLDFAKSMNIKKPLKIIDQIKNVAGEWKKYASECGVEKEQAKYISDLLIFKV